MKRTSLLLHFFLCFLFCSNIIAQDDTQDSSSDLAKLSYDVLDSLMYFNFSAGNYSKALIYIQVASKKTKIEFGSLDTTYATYLVWDGYLNSHLGNYSEAEVAYLEVLNIREQVYGQVNTNYALSLSHLASLYRDNGDYLKAEPLLIESVSLQEKLVGKYHKNYAYAIANLAGFYQQMEYYANAEPLIYEQINIYAKIYGKEHLDYAKSISALATLYLDMGNYAKAEPTFIEATNIFEKVLGKQHPSYASALANLALFYKKTNQYKKVAPLMLESKNIIEKTLGKKHPYYASSLNNLAMFYDQNNQIHKAIDLYQKSIKIYANTLGKKHPYYASSLNNLAILFHGIGNTEKASTLFREVISIREQLYGKENPIYASSLIDLASMYLKVEALDSAFKYYIAGIDANCAEIDSQLTDFGRLDQYHYYSNQTINASIKGLLNILTIQFRLTGNPETLKLRYQVANVAMKLNEQIRNNLKDEKDKLRFLNSNTYFVRQGIETALLLKKNIYTQEAFFFAEKNKSILLADAVKGNRARSLGDLPDSLGQKEILFQNKLTKLKKQQINSLESKDISVQRLNKNQINKSLIELNLERETFLKSLKDKYPKYHALKYENITANAQDVQSLLDNKTLLLEYFQTDSILYLFAVSKTKVELFPLALKKKMLKKRIQKLRFALSNYKFITKKRTKAYEAYTEQAYWFYKNILKVALGNKSIENLIVIADGELGHLPFEAFLTKNYAQKESKYSDLHYLVNDYNISYNYSATLWKESFVTKNKQTNNKILACVAAYPTVDSSLLAIRLPYFFKLRTQLQPLPAAQQEIATLAENFQGKFLIITVCCDRGNVIVNA